MKLLLKKSVRQEIGKYPKTTAFLDTVGKNSLRTRSNYLTGLVHLQRFLNQQFGHEYNVDSIIDSILHDQLNVYELLDGFVSYESIKENLERNNPRNIITHLIGIKSYFAYYDIDIIPSKFKRKVKMPKILNEKEEPIDAADIRKILLSCNNRRLKTYLLVLASGGSRAVEGCAIRIKDINSESSPTKIHIRADYSKTRVGRDIYISDEATTYLKQWLEWKCRKRSLNPDDLLFNTFNVKSRPEDLYVKISSEFTKGTKDCRFR